jgi:RNA binding exosome subunit
MKLAHFIEMRVFSKEEDDEDRIMQAIASLFPIDKDKEKLPLKSKISYGFEDKKIKIITVNVHKDRQTRAVLAHLAEHISEDQKRLLLRQLESRLDDHLHFYLRLDKDLLLEGEYAITDSGNCFHFKIAVAAFPHKREIAKNIIEDWLTKGQV